MINPVVSEQTKEALLSQQSEIINKFTKRFHELLKQQIGGGETNNDLHKNNNVLISFAPGRINLIGEHVDYLGGNVLPAAIDKGVFSFGIQIKDLSLSSSNSTKKSRQWTFLCNDGNEVQEFVEENEGGALTRIERKEGETVPRWAKYVQETFNQVKAENIKESEEKNQNRRYVIAVFSTLPVGAGLSSSAAFNISIANLVAGLKTSTPAAVVRSETLPPVSTSGVTLNRSLLLSSSSSLSNEKADQQAYTSRLRLALLAQQTEHKTGTMCGIMDQLASLFGAPSTCLLTDCAQCQLSPVSLDKLTSQGVRFLLVNSVVPHELGDAYNKLRAALERAQNALAKIIKNNETKDGFSAVSWAKEELLKMMKMSSEEGGAMMSKLRPHEIAEEVGKNLVKIAVQEADASPEDALKLSYVASETCRTILFCQRLQEQEQGNSLLDDLGELLNATHHGLSKILQVSTPELDFIQNYLEEGKKKGRFDHENFKCFGSRMMGGGFGGCVLCLVSVKNGTEDIEAFMRESHDFMPVFGKTFFNKENDGEKFDGVWYDVMVGGGATLIV